MRNNGVGKRIVTLAKEKRMVLIIAAGALGVLLLFLSELGGSVKSAKKDAGTDFDADAYVQTVERRLCALIGEIRGAGETRVMITLESAEERFFAEDRESESASGDGGDRQSAQSKIAAASDGGLQTRRREPEIRGVAVVCEGAGSETVRREITETVRAALGVGRDRIYVAQMR